MDLVTAAPEKNAGLLKMLHKKQTPFNGLFSRTTWLSQYQKGKTSLDFTEARDYGVLERQWIICRQSAPRSRQIAMPTPHQSTAWMLFLTSSQQFYC